MISPGSLPKGVTLTDLGHKSLRRNPLVADLLHRIDFIEKAGTGIRRIRDGAKAVDCPEPEFKADSFVTVTFRPNPEVRQAAGGELAPIPEVTGEATGEVAGEVTDQVAGQVTEQVAGQVTEQVAGQVRLLQALSGEMSRQSLQEALGLKHRNHFNQIYLIPALEAGLIEMTIPDKPRSSKQRYRLTPAGSEVLKRIEEGQ